MNLYALGDRRPVIEDEDDVFIAPGARVIGDVRIGRGVSIWFNAVLRGDNEPITIGAGSNVQDGCILHTDPGFPLAIGERVTLGHGAIVHGCWIGDECLVGMGATVLNGATLGAGCLVGAGALVTERRSFEDGSMILGSPAKAVRSLDDAAREGLRQAALAYTEKLARYRDRLDPL